MLLSTRNAISAVGTPLPRSWGTVRSEKRWCRPYSTTRLVCIFLLAVEVAFRNVENESRKRVTPATCSIIIYQQSIIVVNDTYSVRNWQQARVKSGDSCFQASCTAGVQLYPGHESGFCLQSAMPPPTPSAVDGRARKGRRKAV